MRCFLILVFILTACIGLAQQPPVTKEELEKRRESILEAIKITQEQLEATKNDKNASLAQLRALQNKLAERQKLINNINQEINHIDHNIQNSTREVNQLQQNLEQLKIKYAQSVRYAYRNRSSYNMLAFLFSAEDFNQAIRRLKYLRKYRDYRKQQADEIRATQSHIQQKIGALHNEKNQKNMLRSTEEEQKQVIQKETLEKDKVVRELKGREKELASSITRNQKSLKQLEKTIANMIQREIELARKKAEEEERKRKEEEKKRMLAANPSVNSNTGTKPGAPAGDNRGNLLPDKPGATTSKPSTPIASNIATPSRPAPTSYSLSLTPEVAALSENFANNRGKLPWPVEKGFIADYFGRKKHPVYNIMMENNGIDIQSAPGAAARTVFGGKVTGVLFVPGMGQMVMINHGQFFTVYSKLENVTVKKGQEVGMKQVIGTVAPGDNNDYLMHFELWKVGTNDKAAPQDPAQWIAR